VSAARCDCEPTRYDDGSISHEPDCNVYPWCPHEVVAYSCLMPCGCQCEPCARLTEANR
jgi:hypothetical protein